MTRKDYVLIASVIREQWLSQRQRMQLVRDLSTQLERDNPRFNSERFTSACFAGIVFTTPTPEAFHVPSATCSCAECK